jgi:hypothetical protein
MPMTPPQDVVREETTEPTKTARPKEVAHDEAPSIVDDHPFKPKDHWWSLCEVCNLSEAAHTETTLLHYVGDDMPDD